MPAGRDPHDGIPADESPTKLIYLPEDSHAQDGPARNTASDDDVEVHPDDDFEDLEDLEEEFESDKDLDVESEAESDDEAVTKKTSSKKPIPPRRGGGRGSRRAEKQERSRKVGWLAAITVLVLLAGGAWYGINSIFGYDDYEGTGESDVLIQVADGDSTNAIASKLAQEDVVASAKAFVNASEDNSKVRNVQPGYYVMKTKMSGATAVEKMIEPASRVGVLQLRPGTQLDDLTQPDGKTTDGVFAQLRKASCATLNGTSTCVSVEDLRKVAETADLASLGLPSWAVTAVANVEPKRRLEGLIQPGVYDVKPGWDANQLLGEVLKVSAKRLQSAGLGASAGHQGVTPYQTLVIASLIEREAVKEDFDKVSAVIYNRLTKNMKMEFDSTINYILDRPVVRTKPEDRARAGAYNTYQNVGLPPTPISAPSKEAIAAAEKPASGSWIFFVKCEKNGLSCFADTNAEHEQNVRDAQARGAY